MIRKLPSLLDPIFLPLTSFSYYTDPECLQFTVTCHERMPGSKFINNIGKAADILMDLMEKESSSAVKL